MVGTVDVVVVVGHGQRGAADCPSAAVEEASTRCRNTTMKDQQQLHLRTNPIASAPASTRSTAVHR